MMKMKFVLRHGLLLLLLAACAAVYAEKTTPGELEVAPNGRYLQYADGRPFF